MLTVWDDHLYLDKGIFLIVDNKEAFLDLGYLQFM